MRCWASQTLRSLRRSSSVAPPQIPASWLVARANSRHSSLTVHAPQILRAVSICSTAGPLLPIGKNTSGSESRHAERVRHALTSQSCVRTQVNATLHSPSECSGGMSVYERPRASLEALESETNFVRPRAQGADQEFHVCCESLAW